MKNSIVRIVGKYQMLLCLMFKVLFSFFSAFYIQKYMRLPDNDFLWVLISIFLYYLFNKKCSWNKRKDFFMVLFFCVLLSLSNIGGFHIVTNGNFYFGVLTENYITSYSGNDYVGFFILTYVFYKGFGLIYQLISSKNFSIHLEKMNGKVNYKYVIVVSAFIFVSWLPYFLVYYPGFIFPDSLASIYQALEEYPLNNHHPILYTLFIRICLRVGIMIKSITVGCAIYTITQMIYISFSLGYMICWLRSKGVTLKFSLIIMISFAFLPFIAQNSIAMWKDPIFSASILLWTLLLLDGVLSDGAVILRDRFYTLKSSLLIFLICFSRNNGFYLILFSEIIFIIVLITTKSKNLMLGIKKISVKIGIMLVCIYLITGPIYSHIGIKDEPVESLGIFLNQMARVVTYEGKMSDKDYEFMGKLLPIELYPETYRPCVVDMLKWDENFNNNYLNEHLDEFIKTYFSLLIRNPRLYIEAWELNTFGYWAINYWELFSDNINIEKGGWDSFYTMDMKGIKPRNLLGKININWNALFSYRGTTIYLAVLNWLILFIVIVLLIKRGEKYLIVLAPSIGLIGTLLIATPYVYWQRYGLAEYYLLPVYIFILSIVLKEESI